MARIIALPGSLRRDSFNAALARAAVQHSPDGLSVEVASISGIPLYDRDDEAEHGIPGVVTALQDRIAGADGILLCSPEYNGSLPGVFKNAIDWLTRPPKQIDRVFSGKALGLMGATPGPGGTRLGQLAWLPVLRALRVRPYLGHSLFVARAGQAFEDGALADDDIKERLRAYLKGFASFV